MRKSTVLFIVGAISICSALGFAVYNVHESTEAGYQATTVTTLVTQVIKENTVDTYGEDIEVYPDYMLNSEIEMPVVEVEGDEYVGVLSIPSLELDLPIMKTLTYSKLKSAPCMWKGSAYDGDMIIAGHNYGTHFGNLSSLSEGDTVSFIDIDGNLFDYEVSEVEILEGTAIEEMQAGNWDLTLFTCTYGGERRVTVRCTEK